MSQSQNISPDIAIQLNGISRTYTINSAQVQALRGIDLQIKRGEMVAITGRSGAGKSTLLHIIGTLDRPTSGELWLNGTDVSKMDDGAVSRFRNKSVGFVFQMNNLLPEFTAVENVMMPGIIAGLPRIAMQKRSVELLDALGLGGRTDHRPSELSGGEQQRVAIARAMVLSAPILVADEPTGNLDKSTSAMIQELLLGVVKNYGVTLVLVTHDLELAKKLPRQIVIEDGKLIRDSASEIIEEVSIG
jgi:lipoprotein-releasing system ATP-binding protein